MCPIPRIDDRTDGHLAKVMEIAKANGLWRGRNGLRRRLTYLASYANRRGCMYDRKVPGQGTRCVLYKDWAPLSFGFYIERLIDGEWKHWFTGGMIYQGPGCEADGSFPSLTVSLSRFTGWGIHT